MTEPVKLRGEYVTLAQGAAMLGVSRSALWTHIQDGQVPATVVGPRCLLIEVQALTQFQEYKRGPKIHQPPDLREDFNACMSNQPR